MEKLTDAIKQIAVLLCVVAFVGYAIKPCIKGENKQYFTEASSTANPYTQGEFNKRYGVALCKIRAESAFFPQKRDICEIIKGYRAHVVFTERVDGITNYYCHSYALPVGIRLKGKSVNLHVAVADYGYTVGYPIIVGGY